MTIFIKNYHSRKTKATIIWQDFTKMRAHKAIKEVCEVGTPQRDCNVGRGMESLRSSPVGRSIPGVNPTQPRCSPGALEHLRRPPSNPGGF